MNSNEPSSKLRTQMLDSLILPAVSTLVLKSFTEHWKQELSSKPTAAELLLQSDSTDQEQQEQFKPMSARQTVGLDLYEAQILVKAVHKTHTTHPNLTLSGMFELFDQAFAALFPVDAKIIELDVIAAASHPGKKNKQAQIELAREKRVLTHACRVVTWSDVAALSTSSSSFFHVLKAAMFGNIKRINNCLQRLCALRGRIAVGKWIPPTVVRAQLKQSKHARQVQQQFSQFKSLIRKKE